MATTRPPRLSLPLELAALKHLILVIKAATPRTNQMNKMSATDRLCFLFFTDSDSMMK